MNLLRGLAAVARRSIGGLDTVLIVVVVKPLQNGVVQFAKWLTSLLKMASLHNFRKVISLACGKQVLTGL
jgi:hypothetical protein